MMARNIAMAATLLLTGCPKAPLAGPPRAETATYGVAVAVASGPRVVTSLYELEVAHDQGNVWTFRTVSSEGSWEEHGERILFDSEQPRSSDPWPVVYQHAISALPTALVMEDGLPVALATEPRWRKAADEVVRGLDRLPPESVTTGLALIDPAGVVRDMQRNFPGQPPEGSWERAISVAAVPAILKEDCSREVANGVTTWTCRGAAQGPDEGAARLHEVTSKTVLVIDRFGLASMDLTWAGTLVVLAPDQKGVIDRPVAGHRLVQRKSPAPPGA